MQKMYYTLHETDITKFVGTADQLMKEYFSETNLKRIRTAYGLTQAELAKRSGVSLRSIQMYDSETRISTRPVSRRFTVLQRCWDAPLRISSRNKKALPESDFHRFREFVYDTE